jgi:hypothetical protein
VLIGSPATESVIVYTRNGRAQVIGPFATADEAREYSNALGLASSLGTIEVVPLLVPAMG